VTTREKIRHQRELQRRTLADVGAAAGWRAQRQWDIENRTDAGELKLATIQRVADALGVDWTTLVGD